MFGKDRLREAIRSASDRPATEIEAEVLRRLYEFLGPVKPKDDVTFVVVKVVPG
jgi:serine phosphatase RsbU (regulator of sigma subunit)